MDHTTSKNQATKMFRPAIDTLAFYIDRNQKLIDLLKKYNVSLTAIAEHLGVSKQAVSQMYSKRGQE